MANGNGHGPEWRQDEDAGIMGPAYRPLPSIESIASITSMASYRYSELNSRQYRRAIADQE